MYLGSARCMNEWTSIVIVLEKRSNFAPNINFELRVPLNRAVCELQNTLSSIKNG